MYGFSPLIIGQMVHSVRQRCGRQLAKEAPVDVDLVSTVPDSATPAALAYAAQVRGFLKHSIKHLRIFATKCLLQVRFNVH